MKQSSELMEMASCSELMEMMSVLSDEGWTSTRKRFLFCMMTSTADSTNVGRRSSRISLSIRRKAREIALSSEASTDSLTILVRVASEMGLVPAGDMDEGACRSMQRGCCGG